MFICLNVKMKRILLVEDDPFLVDIYSTKLKEEGFSVQIVTDGKDALKKLKKDAPDLLLLDIVLPNFNGWEILRKIGRDDELKTLKVVILSNLGEKEEIEKGLNLGAAEYLVKAHYTPSEVVEEVKKILNKL